MSPDTVEKQDEIKEEEIKEEGGADSLNRNAIEAEARPVKKTTRRRRSTKKTAPQKEVEPKEQAEPEEQAEPDIQLSIETKDGEVVEIEGFVEEEAIEIEGVIEERPDNPEPGDRVNLTSVKLTEVEPSELEPAIEIPWIPPKRVIVKNVGGGPAVVGVKTLLPGEVGPATWPQFLAAADTHRGWFLWSEVGEINFRSDIPA